MSPANRIRSAGAVLAVTLFVVFVPLFLIAVNVRWVINAPALYSYGYDRYEEQIRRFLDIEREEYVSGGRQIRDYFNGDEKWLFMQVEVRGVRYPNIYNRTEMIHMWDVKRLVRWVYRAAEIAGAYLLGFAIVGLCMQGRRFAGTLARLAALGGWLTLALGAAVGLGSLAGFDRLFLIFHQVSFTNDFWQLDPRRDNLIAMFPQGFFLDATLLIVGAVVVQAALLAAVPFVLSRRRGAAHSDR